MDDLVPTEYYLSQNSPNPFTVKTTIKYCVPEEAGIKLEIYYSREQKIETLVDEIKEPGTYKVEFRPADLKDGIYLYQLTAGNVILTKKMLILNDLLELTLP